MPETSENQSAISQGHCLIAASSWLLVTSPQKHKKKSQTFLFNELVLPLTKFLTDASILGFWGESQQWLAATGIPLTPDLICHLHHMRLYKPLSRRNQAQAPFAMFCASTGMPLKPVSYLILSFKFIYQLEISIF